MTIMIATTIIIDQTLTGYDTPSTSSPGQNAQSITKTVNQDIPKVEIANGDMIRPSIRAQETIRVLRHSLKYCGAGKTVSLLPSLP